MQKYSITISNGLIAETTTENGDYYLVTEVDAILAEKDKMIAAFMGEMDHDQKEAEYLHEQIATMKAALAKTCEWEQMADGEWETDCGNIFEFIEGTPNENSAKYCQYCGGNLRQKLYEEEALRGEG